MVEALRFSRRSESASAFVNLASRSFDALMSVSALRLFARHAQFFAQLEQVLVAGLECAMRGRCRSRD